MGPWVRISAGWYEPPKIASLPWTSRTRSSSAAAMSNASSQGRSTKSSDPRPSRRRVSSQPRRMDGRLTRVRWWTAAGIISGISDGCGSCENGRVATIRPSSTSTSNAPQWLDVTFVRLSDRSVTGASRAIHFPCPAQVYAAIGAIGGFFFEECRRRGPRSACLPPCLSSIPHELHCAGERLDSPPDKGQFASAVKVRFPSRRSPSRTAQCGHASTGLTLQRNCRIAGVRARRSIPTFGWSALRTFRALGKIRSWWYAD